MGMEASGGSSKCFELLKKGKFKFVQSGLNISQHCILVQHAPAVDWSRWKSEVCFNQPPMQKHCENDQAVGLLLPLLLGYSTQTLRKSAEHSFPFFIRQLA